MTVLALFLILPCSSLTSLTFIFSNHTPSLLQSQILQALDSEILSDYNVQVYNYSQDPLPDFHTDFLVDFTFSLSLAFRFKEIACRKGLVLLMTSLPSPSSMMSSSCVYYTHAPLSHHSQALTVLLNYLEWDDLFMTSSVSQKSRQMSHEIFASLSKKDVLIQDSGVFMNESQQTDIDKYIAKTIKPSLKRNVVVLNEPAGSEKVIKSCINKHMYKEGLGVVIGSLGSLGEYRLGTLYLVEKGTEEAKNEGEYEIFSILKIVEIAKTKGVSKLKETFRENTANKEFCVMNYKTDTLKEKVGEIKNSTYTRISAIIFPGNVTEIPNEKHRLPFSLNINPFNYDGTSDYGLTAVHAGTDVIVNLINSDPSFLPNYQFEMYKTGCGPTAFNHEYFINCYSSQLDKMGYFFLESYSIEVTIGTMTVFRQLGFKIPIIGISTSFEDLYDKEMYPEFVVPSADMIYVASILPNILQAMRWMNVIVFATEYNGYIYDIFMRRTKDIGINVLNDPKFHFFNINYTTDQYEAYKEHYQDAFDTKGTIFVLFAETPIEFYIVQGLYDFGYREGDIQLIYNIKLKDLLLRPELYDYDLSKVSKLLSGSIGIYYAEWVGEYGEWLEPIVAKAVEPLSTGFLCLPIDSFLLGAYAIEMMIRIGKDFEDPLELMNYIRQQRFSGCSGIVSIDSSSNGRSILSYSIYNLYNDTNTNAFEEKPVGSYTIGVSVPLVISKDIVWPEGHTQPMSDIREDPECGIPVVVRRELQKSKDLSLYIFIGLLCCCCVVSVALSYRYWRFKDEFLSTPAPMTFEDGVYMLSGSIEGVQLATIAPCSSQIPEFVLYYMKMTILDIEMKNEEYWRLIVAVMITSSLWSVCCMISLCVNMQTWKQFIKDSITTIGVRLFPYVSLLCLIPFSRTLFSVFVCQEASGENLTDAYFYRDCNISCWKDFHFVFVVLASISIFVYLTVATLSRLYWDEYSDYTHIKTNPRYALWKGLLYGTLAGLSILPIDEIKYFVIFCCFLILHAILNFLTNQTNYKRFNSWLRLGIIALIWVIAVNIIGEGESIFLTTGLQIGGLAVLGLIGILIQVKYFPTMFYREKAIRVYDLFRFGLTSKVDKETINRSINALKRGANRSQMKYIYNIDDNN